MINRFVVRSFDGKEKITTTKLLRQRNSTSIEKNKPQEENKEIKYNNKKDAFSNYISYLFLNACCNNAMLKTRNTPPYK